MATTLPVLLLVAGLVFFAAADNDCDAYLSSSGAYVRSQDCPFFQFCCGSCDKRYCCSEYHKKLDDEYCGMFFGLGESGDTFSSRSKMNSITIGSIIGGIIFIIVLFVVCCVSPCCCLYKLCRKPRPVLTTTTHTTVISSQYPQQPTNPEYTSPAYQHVPAQPGYGAQPGYPGQPMAPAPYQGQPYAPGPPPPYHESGPGYPAPYSQAAYDGGQPPYPLQPPTQPGFAKPPPTTDYSATQPPYNPAYVEPPRTGY